jgi:hypothetical protein
VSDTDNGKATTLLPVHSVWTLKFAQWGGNAESTSLTWFAMHQGGQLEGQKRAALAKISQPYIMGSTSNAPVVSSGF